MPMLNPVGIPRDLKNAVFVFINWLSSVAME